MGLVRSRHGRTGLGCQRERCKSLGGRDEKNTVLVEEGDPESRTKTINKGRVLDRATLPYGVGTHLPPGGKPSIYTHLYVYLESPIIFIIKQTKLCDGGFRRCTPSYFWYVPLQTIVRRYTASSFWLHFIPK